MTLAQFMDSKTLETIVGITRIVEASGFCERTVREALHALRLGGWILERSKGRGHPVIRTAMIPMALTNTTIASTTNPASDAALPRQEMPGVTPANGTGEPGQLAPHTAVSDAAYLDKSLEENLGAASPSSTNAVSAALEEKTDEVMRLHCDGLPPAAIAKRMRHDWNVMCSTTEVVRLIARQSGP